jgi:iron(III) transport system substrate-binding protein
MLFCFAPAPIGSQADPPAALVEGAKKEGELSFYSGIFETEARAVLSRFEKKYPFIRTVFYRSGGVGLVSRIQNEHRAGSERWDVFNSAGLEGFVLLEQGYFARYDSPERRQFRDGFKDVEGYWTTMYATPYVPTYHTGLVAAKDVPKDYMHLLEPHWQGKLGLDPEDIEWYANLKKFWGEEKTKNFFSGLSKQKVTIRRGRALQTDLLAAGEFSVLVNNYYHIAVRVKQRGGPVDYLTLDPVITGAGPIAINRLAPHPNAARLFVDFALSREGQEILVQQGRSSGRSDIRINPLAEMKSVKVVPSDLKLGKAYVEARNEYENLLGIRRR